MKTIDEVAKEYAGMSDDKFANSAKKYDAFDLKQAFEYGVEFAQQFINVDEELPNKNCVVIVKNKSMPPVRSTAFFDFKEKLFYPDFLLKNEDVFYWRLIELK